MGTKVFRIDWNQQGKIADTKESTMRWQIEGKALARRQYSNWQIPKAIRDQLGLEDGDPCTITVKAGKKRLTRTYRLTSGGEIRLRAVDETAVRAAASLGHELIFEVAVVEPDDAKLSSARKLIPHALLRRTLQHMKGTLFTTSEFMDEFRAGNAEHHRQVVQAYGKGGKGSGSHYSARVHFARSLSSLARDEASQPALRFVEYVKAPPDAGSPVVALWAYGAGDDGVRWSTSLDVDLASIIENKKLTTTQREQLVLARVGQGGFRQSLISHWGRCAVTGCEFVQALTASHIKPWAASSDKERLDPNNGLLLIPNLDRLFDQGLISFSDEGKLMVSGKLKPKERANFGLRAGMKVKLSKAHQAYMAFHRDNVFLQPKKV